MYSNSSESAASSEQIKEDVDKIDPKEYLKCEHFRLYLLKKMLGSGGFGSVLLQCDEEKCKYVIKIMPPQSRNYRSSFTNVRNSIRFYNNDRVAFEHFSDSQKEMEYTNEIAEKSLADYGFALSPKIYDVQWCQNPLQLPYYSNNTNHLILSIMDFIDGITLQKYLERYIIGDQFVKNLENYIDMFHKIAPNGHGDFNLNNIMVIENGNQFKFIDISPQSPKRPEWFDYVTMIYYLLSNYNRKRIRPINRKKIFDLIREKIPQVSDLQKYLMDRNIIDERGNLLVLGRGYIRRDIPQQHRRVMYYLYKFLKDPKLQTYNLLFPPHTQENKDAFYFFNT